MSEKKGDQFIEIDCKVDVLLNEIVEKFDLNYVSDVRMAENRKRILAYIEELNISMKEEELYHNVMKYING